MTSQLESALNFEFDGLYMNPKGLTVIEMWSCKTRVLFLKLPRTYQHHKTIRMWQESKGKRALSACVFNHENESSPLSLCTPGSLVENARAPRAFHCVCHPQMRAEVARFQSLKLVISCNDKPIGKCTRFRVCRSLNGRKWITGY